MADTNLEQTVFEYSPRIPIQFIPKPNKYVLKAEEFNNYMHGLTIACGSYYTCIKELQQNFDSLIADGVANNSVTTAHLQNGIITSEKIALENIEDKHIAPDAISHNKLSAGAFYQLLRKTYGVVDRRSKAAVKEIIIEHLAHEENNEGYYRISNSAEAQGIVLSYDSKLSDIGTKCHVLFHDGFRISLTNPLDQGWSDSEASPLHVLSKASSLNSTIGLSVKLYRSEDDGNLVLYYITDFWSSSGPAYAGTYKLYYALF